MVNANMKRDELIKAAMDLGLKGITKLNKEQLVEAINNKMEENNMRANGVSVGDLEITRDNANVEEENNMKKQNNTQAQVNNSVSNKEEKVMGKKFVVTGKDASYLMKRLFADMRVITVGNEMYVTENGLFFVPTKATGKLEAANGIIMMTTLKNIKGVIKTHILVKNGKKEWQIKKEDRVDDAMIQAYLDTLVSNRYISVIENDGKDGKSVPVYYFKRSQLKFFAEQGWITSANILQVK